MVTSKRYCCKNAKEEPYRQFIPNRTISIPTPMKSNPSFIPAVIEFDIIRCRMCLKCQSRPRRLCLTVCIIDRTILVITRKLTPNSQITIQRYLAHVPNGETIRIAVVTTLWSVFGSVEVAMEVQLLTGIVLVYILAGTVEVVDGVLNGVDAACLRVFRDTYRVT